jgi:drug/metabolite transporter (DMT)-like permease
VSKSSHRFTSHDVGMLLVSLCWGGNFAASKFALTQISPLPFSAFRFAMGSGLLIAATRVMGASRPLPRRTLLWLVILGLVGNTLYQTAFMTGLRITTATNSAMIVAFLPVMVAILGAVSGIERATPAMWMGVLLGTAGVALVVGARGVSWSSASLAGDLLVLFATLCWAVYTVGVRRVGKGVDPMQITSITVAAGAAGLLLVGGPGLLREDWGAVTFETWAAVAYSTILALVISAPLFNRAVQGIGSDRTALYNCLTPLVAMAVAWVTLREVPTGPQFLGVGLVLGGVWLAITASTESANR